MAIPLSSIQESLEKKWALRSRIERKERKIDRERGNEIWNRNEVVTKE